jgi:hypothetical protein
MPSGAAEGITCRVRGPREQPAGFGHGLPDQADVPGCFLAGAGWEFADTGQQMVTVLDELGLTGLVTSIPGISAIGAASIPGRDRRPGKAAPRCAWRPGARSGER